MILSETVEIILSVVKTKVEFIRRQVNGVAHVLVKADFCIFIDTTCIRDILINEML